MTGRRFCVPVVLLTLGMVVPAAAQEPDFTFGATAGITLSKAGGDDVPSGESKTVFGTAVGAFLTLGATRRFAFEPQLLMLEKGLKAEEGDFSSQIKLTYLQLSLLGKARIPLGGVTGVVFGGPALGLKVGCRFTLASEGNELNGGCEEGEEEDDQAFKNNEASAIAGIGVEIGRAVISLRYDYGFTSIDDSFPQQSIKNRTILLAGAVKLRMPR